MLKITFFIALIPLLLTSSHVSAVQISKHLTTVIEPQPIQRVAPRYPVNAARNNREGWAKMSYIIEKDGSVSNVLVTETSGSADFARASKAAVLKWKFNPALENGEPIQQCVNTVQMDFRMNTGGAKGVSRRFNSKYNAAKKALANKDLVGTKKIIDEMFALKKRHMSENNYLHLLAANYEAQKGNKKQQLHHLHNVALRLLNDEMKLSVLSSSIVLEVTEGKFHQAYKTYKQLSKMEIAKPYMKNYSNIIEKVDAFIGSENNIVVDANIENKDYWHYRLIRNNFSLIDIKGSLSKLDVRCANKRHVYSVEENNTWKIPQAWKNCSIYVFGENNTEFSVVEHPFKT